IRFNIAMCLEQLGQYREAEQTYEAALESGGLTPEGRARAQMRIDRLRARLATLSLKHPEGAHLTVDDELSCIAPCELRIDPGAHTWVWRYQGRSQSSHLMAEPGGHVELHVASVNPARAQRPHRAAER